MRTLKLQMQMSVDGFISGPNGEMDWLNFNWDDELKRYVSGITEPVDTILLGRRLAEGFIPHWAAHPELEGAEKINATSKIVFTQTLTDCPWRNTVLATGDLTEEVRRIKAESGGDLIVYGGGTFVSELIRRNLIDEYHLFVNPAAIGNGKPIFLTRQNLRLTTSVPFPCGIVLLRYVPSS